MSLLFIEGPAGSGKTTRLIQELDAALQATPLEEHQKVLALTKIHGSRRRLQAQLGHLHTLRHRFECMTADSYARRLLGRWCSLSRKHFGNVPSVDDHDEFCKRAADLIVEDAVNQWVTRTYPIVVVDEMQDSKGGQLRMLQMLARSATCLAAGDDFQDLEEVGENHAVSWARENGQVITLVQIHRTSVQGLLDAAKAVREAREVVNGKGFDMVSVPKPQFGAWYVSKHISRWRKKGNVVIITPTGPDKSVFVRDLITRVESAPIGKKWKYGPHSVSWALSHHTAFEQFVAKIKLPDDPCEEISEDQLDLDDTYGPSSALARWLDRKRRVSGKTKFSVAEVRAQISLILQRTRAFGHSWNRGVSAMTVHQAKNREFDSVIVPWPLRIKGSGERQRRVFYNAITRAKQQALVVIEDPKKNRMQNPPFVSVSSRQA